jgi:hypothetical protein
LRLGFFRLFAIGCNGGAGNLVKLIPELLGQVIDFETGDGLALGTFRVKASLEAGSLELTSPGKPA